MREPPIWEQEPTLAARAAQERESKPKPNGATNPWQHGDNLRFRFTPFRDIELARHRPTGFTNYYHVSGSPSFDAAQNQEKPSGRLTWKCISRWAGTTAAVTSSKV